MAESKSGGGGKVGTQWMGREKGKDVRSSNIVAAKVHA